MILSFFDKQDRFRYAVNLPIAPSIKQSQLKKLARLIVRGLRKKPRYVKIEGQEKIKL